VDREFLSTIFKETGFKSWFDTAHPFLGVPGDSDDEDEMPF
jgi:hypothetical protein